jgi:hypothetical protein
MAYRFFLGMHLCLFVKTRLLLFNMKYNILFSFLATSLLFNSPSANLGLDQSERQKVK